MKIITVPHPTLRIPAQPVTKVDKKLKIFVKDLEETLKRKNNPRGVGLAAPQVDIKWRIFVTQLPPINSQHDQSGDRPEADEPTELRVFINPEITEHSEAMTLGPDKKEPILEGCLSVPGIWGPVPRWEWVTLTYQSIVNEELVARTEKFQDFAARVVQHEHDHLNGVLFIDYSLEYELPLYKENPKNEKLYEIEAELLPAFVAQTR